MFFSFGLSVSASQHQPTVCFHRYVTLNHPFSCHKHHIESGSANSKFDSVNFDSFQTFSRSRLLHRFELELSFLIHIRVKSGNPSFFKTAAVSFLKSPSQRSPRDARSCRSERRNTDEARWHVATFFIPGSLVGNFMFLKVLSRSNRVKKKKTVKSKWEEAFGFRPSESNGFSPEPPFCSSVFTKALRRGFGCGGPRRPRRQKIDGLSFWESGEQLFLLTNRSLDLTILSLEPPTQKRTNGWTLNTLLLF